MKKVFFSASVYGMYELYENYSKILDCIKKQDCEIQENWVEDMKNKIKNKDGGGDSKSKSSTKIMEEIREHIDPVEFFSDHIKAIDSSDALVAEISRKSIGVGYQIFYASTKKKPILVLYTPQLADPQYVKTIANINSPFITVKKYTNKSLPYIISHFLKGKDKVLRKFNFIISKEIEDYLEWLHKKNPDKSKSELLRQKMESDLILNDENYIDYLNSNS